MARRLRSTSRKDSTINWEELRNDEDEQPGNSSSENDEPLGDERLEDGGAQPGVATLADEHRDLLVGREPRAETTVPVPLTASATLTDSTSSTTTLLLNLIQTMNDERRKDESKRDERWENVIKILAGGTASASEKSISDHESSRDHLIPKFRKLERGEDVESYFCAFEAHMDGYDVKKQFWTKHLAPILNPDASVVYTTLESEERRSYDKLKKTLLDHYSVDRSTYRLKLDQFKRVSGETWIICAKRCKGLVKHWAADCDTIDDILELVSLDIVTKLMPRPVANHVKDSKPTTVGEAAKLADDFMRHRGWNYSQPEESERSKPRTWKKDDKSSATASTETTTQPSTDNSTQSSIKSTSSTTTRATSSNRDVKRTNGKKFIDPKHFDPEKGAQCFNCNEWGHISKECPKKVAMIVKTVCLNEHKDWHTIPGQIGTNDCQVAVDSGAEITVVSADLVPETAKTGERQWIRGVHPYEESVPLAKVLIQLANQRIWVTAAAVEDLPFDVLLG